MAAAIFIHAAGTTTVLSQQRGVRGGPTYADEGPQVEQSSEVLNLLRTAQDAVDRADWKLAIDSLVRVIADPKGLRESDEYSALYVSPRLHAYTMLASLPPEGLEAYRILYDGRAKGLLDQARRDHDPAALRQICDQYLLTRYGAEAGRMLASWLIDVGREAEAIVVLDDVLAVHPDGQGLLPQIELARAVCLELLGDGAGATAVLSEARRAMTEVGRADTAIVEAVEAFVSASRGSVLARASRPVGDWVGPGGGGACTGRMESVVPSFAAQLPWRRAIPSVIPGVWPDLDALGPNRLPVTQPLVVDGRVLVKAGRECVAVDLQSFAVLWTGQRSVEGMAERVRGRSSVGTSEEQLLSDYVVGTLSASHGMVFNVERGNAGVDSVADGIVVVQRGGVRQVTPEKDTSNRLAAYDLQTGQRRWQRGRANDPDERLQRVQFLAPAVGVGDELWVPFEFAGDLYAGVLDPDTGDLISQVFLCALGGREVNGSVGLLPAVADGTVFVPTDQGLLFAIDAAGRHIRWASRYRVPPMPSGYRRMQREAPSPSSLDAWLSGPPVIVGGLVILAPTDDDRLLVFDRRSGAVLWEVPRDRHRYIIAADQDHIWVGGSDVSCVSIRDRAYTWIAPVVAATGRAVLCGATIYVPNRAGLMAIDSVTGETVELYELPPDQPALGSLLCAGGSLISLDTSELRAFPDRDSYAETLAAHQADPGDTSMAIRLAYMELLNHSPQRALDALSVLRLPDSPDAESHRLYASHLRVEALKQLSGQPGISNEAAVEYLQRAADAAVGRRDRVSAHLALGLKLRSVGRFKEAYRSLQALGLSVGADDLVDAESAPVRQQARTAIGAVLRRIEPELGTTDAAAISEEIRSVFNEARGQLASAETRLAGSQTLLAIAECSLLDGWDQAALNELAGFEMRRGKFERAEQCLLESLRCSSERTGGQAASGTRANISSGQAAGGAPADRKRTAEALLLLMDLYAHPSQSLARSAQEVADRLEREFADVEVEAGRVSALVAERRRQWDPSLVSAHAAATSPEAFAPMQELAYPKPPQEDGLGLVGYRGDRPEALADRALVFVPPRTLRSHLIEDGSLEWESELLMQDDFAYGPSVAPISVSTPSRFQQRTVLLDGQTTIINSRRGLHAIGAISGLRLWAESFDGGEFFGDPLLRNDSTDVGAGRVAYLSAPRTLAVRRVLDGRLLWERQMRSESVGPVRIRDAFVLTADPNLETVHVFDLGGGEQLCKLTFRQPTAGGVRVPISYSGTGGQAARGSGAGGGSGVLCGPDRRAITGYDARSGARLWSVPLPDAPASLFEPTDGRVIAGVEGGYHWLIDTRSGDVIFEGQFDGLIDGARMGVLESGVLVLAGVEDTTEGDLWHLVGVDMDPGSTGRVLWERDVLGTLVGPQLRLARGVIPMVALLAVEESVTGPDGVEHRAVHYQQAVVVIDKHTGEYVAEPVNADTFGERLTGDMAVWRGRLVMQTTKNVITLRTAPLGDRRQPAGGVN